MTTSPHYHLVPKDIRANLRFRRMLLNEAATDPSAASQIRQMCREDLLFYTNAFVWTYNPKNVARGLDPVIPFVTYEFQDKVMLQIVECVETGRDYVIFKSRDMGASWMGLTVKEWLWHWRAYLSFLMVSRNEDYVDKRGNTKSLFWKIDFIHKNMPRWLLPTGRWLGDKDPNRKMLHLKNADNESVIDGESTTGDAGRGDRRTAMFIDEHAAFKVDEGFQVLRSTRDTTDCRGFNSTPQGANNAFSEVVHNTNALKIKLHWSIHPVKSRGLYETNPKTGLVVLLDDWKGEVSVRPKGEDTRICRFPEDYPFQLDKDDPKVRSPWYDDQCARCVSPQEVAAELDIDFLGSDYPFFDPRFIQELRARYACDPILSGDVEFDPETLRPKRFVENPEKGLLKLWIEFGDGECPPRDRNYVIGADVSMGTGASNSVLSIADRETGEKVGVLKTPNMPPIDFANLAIAVCYFFNEAYLVPDASGSTGQSFIGVVIKHGYGNTYRRRYEKKIGNKRTDEPGYYLNPAAKFVLLEDYRSALDRHQFINRSDAGLAECLQFVRKADGIGVEHSAAANSQDPSGARTAHGDEVIADALCSRGVYERQTQAKSKPPELPEGSLAWRRRQKELEAQKDTDETLGDGW